MSNRYRSVTKNVARTKQTKLPALVELTSCEETGNTEKRVSEAMSMEKEQPGDRVGGVVALPH